MMICVWTKPDFVRQAKDEFPSRYLHLIASFLVHIVSSIDIFYIFNRFIKTFNIHYNLKVRIDTNTCRNNLSLARTRDET